MEETAAMMKEGEAMMKKCRDLSHLLLVLLLAGFVAGSVPEKALAETGEGRIVLVSDIHFNPFYDAAIVPELMKTNYRNWHRVFGKSRLKEPSKLGEETNFPLFISAMKRMKITCPQPDFILFSGDTLAHDFKEKFSKFSSSHDEFRRFVEKVYNFISYQMNVFLPGVPIYLTLGNNDGWNGDYEIPPGGGFLHRSADIFFKSWVKGKAANKLQFEGTFLKGGNYVIELAKTGNVSLIVTNSVYFSSRNSYRDEGWEQLKWLRSELSAAQTAGRKVWIIMHIPPGVDVRSSVNHPESPKLYWDESTRSSEDRTYLQDFTHLMVQHGDIVKGVFAGHSHMDHFRLVRHSGGGEAGAFVHICPALSPEFKNNASFEVLYYARETLALEDYETHYYDQNLREWEREYTFSETYHKQALSASSLNEVQTAIGSKPGIRSAFIRLYDVSNRVNDSVNETNWKAYWCGIDRLMPTDFSQCYP